MSSHARITLPFGDGEHAFDLGDIGRLLELQDRCAVGPPSDRQPSGPLRILRRLEGDQWLAQDVRETIRLGLIGGGMKAEDAVLLVKRYVDGRPLAESRPIAHTVLLAALVGVKDDAAGKAQTEGTASEETASLSAPSSTGRAQPSASRRARSTQ